MKTNDELVALLKKEIKKHGDQKALAERIGITPGFLNDILVGRAPVTQQVAEYLGYNKVTGFEKREE
jgi:hypothetical protein